MRLINNRIGNPALVILRPEPRLDSEVNFHMQKPAVRLKRQSQAIRIQRRYRSLVGNLARVFVMIDKIRRFKIPADPQLDLGAIAAAKMRGGRNEDAVLRLLKAGVLVARAAVRARWPHPSHVTAPGPATSFQ